MKRNMRSLFSCPAMALVLVLMASGCTDKSTQGQNAPSDGVVLRTSVSTPALLGSVDYVRLSVTGPGMAPISLDSRTDEEIEFDGASIRVVVTIDYGTDRTFVLEAVQVSVGNIATEVVIYRGEQTVSVLPNRLTTVNLVLEPTVPLVRFQPRRIEGESGKPFSVDVLVANVDSLTSILLEFDCNNSDTVQILSAEPAEELVAAVGSDLVFTARYQLDATVFRVNVARVSGYAPIVDAEGNRRLCTIFFGSTADTAALPDSLETPLTVSVLSAAKPGAASPVIITDEIYTDEAAIHLSLLQDRVVTFADPDVEAAVRSKIEHGPGDIMLFDVLWLADLSLDEVAAEDLGGLENLASLRILWLDSCGAIDLSPLSGLTRLTELKAASNGLTDISPLGGLTNLYTLDLQNNSITNLQPLSRLTKLIRLNLAYNQITDIYPLVENTEFGLYDTLYILGNTGVTGDDTQLGYIATLRTRGVTVYDQIVR
jgi:hypothetical protein